MTDQEMRNIMTTVNVGDKLTCINPGKGNALTAFKEYEVLAISKNHIYCVDDDRDRCEYLACRFATTRSMYNTITSKASREEIQAEIDRLTELLKEIPEEFAHAETEYYLGWTARYIGSLQSNLEYLDDTGWKHFSKVKLVEIKRIK